MHPRNHLPRARISTARPIVLALALLAVVVGARPALAQVDAGARGTSWGAVYRGAWRGEAAVVTLDLRQGAAQARLLLPGQGLALTGEGSASDDGSVRLELTGAQGAAAGVLEAQRSMAPNDDGSRLSGTLTLGPHVGRIALVRVAQRVDRSVREGAIDASLSYPDFLWGAWQPLRDTLDAGWRDEVETFVAQGRDALAHHQLFHGWQLLGDANITLLTGRALSLLTRTYRYTGGAHGLDSYDARTYRMGPDGPQEIALGDLFAPGTDLVARLQGPLLEALERQDAQWILDGEVTSLEEDDLALFNLVPGGLAFTFPPYAMGPYVQGAFTVTLPARDLLDVARTGGILRDLATARADP